MKKRFAVFCFLFASMGAMRRSIWRASSGKRKGEASHTQLI